MASAALLRESEELLCKSCYQLPKDKVYQCKNGHPLCASCYENHGDCPHCGSRLNQVNPCRNWFFEKQVEKCTDDLSELEGNEPDEAPEDHHCPICFNLPEQEVFQCNNGHYLCGSCHQRVLKIIRPDGEGPECPQCRIPFDKVNPIRNVFFEEQLDKYVKVDCAYKLNGCRHRPTRKLLQDHQSKCHFNIERFGKLVNLCNLLGYEGCDFCVNNGNAEDAVRHLLFHHGCVTTEANHFQMELAGFQESIDSTPEEIFLWTPVILDLKEKNCFLLTSVIFNRKVGSLACFSICIPKCNESLADLKIEYSLTGQNVDSLEWKLTQSCIPLSKAQSFLPRNLPCSILPPSICSLFTNDGSLVINFVLQEDHRNILIEETGSNQERIVCAIRKTSSNFLSLYYFRQQQQKVVSYPGLTMNAGICVKDLPEFATKEYIKNFFSDFGKVVSVKMIPQTRSTGQGRASKSCTVSFEHRISVHKVLESKERIRMKRSGKKYRLNVTAERLTMNTECEANTFSDKAQEACEKNKDALMEYILEAFSSTGDSNVIQRVTYLMSFLAAKCGSLESLKYCIEKGIDVNLTGRKPSENTQRSLLSRTISDANSQSSLEKIKYLVESGADIHFEDDLGGSLLHTSVIYGTDEMVKFFLDNGLEVNACNTAGWTALHAAFLTNLEIRFLVEKVKILLDYGASLFIEDNKGRSPLNSMGEAPVEHRDKIKEMFGNHLYHYRVRN